MAAPRPTAVKLNIQRARTVEEISSLRFDNLPKHSATACVALHVLDVLKFISSPDYAQTSEEQKKTVKEKLGEIILLSPPPNSALWKITKSPLFGLPGLTVRLAAGVALLSTYSDVVLDPELVRWLEYNRLRSFSKLTLWTLEDLMVALECLSLRWNDLDTTSALSRANVRKYLDFVWSQSGKIVSSSSKVLLNVEEYRKGRFTDTSIHPEALVCILSRWSYFERDLGFAVEEEDLDGEAAQMSRGAFDAFFFFERNQLKDDRFREQLLKRVHDALLHAGDHEIAAHKNGSETSIGALRKMAGLSLVAKMQRLSTELDYKDFCDYPVLNNEMFIAFVDRWFLSQTSSKFSSRVVKDFSKADQSTVMPSIMRKRGKFYVEIMGEPKSLLSGFRETFVQWVNQMSRLNFQYYESADISGLAVLVSDDT